MPQDTPSRHLDQYLVRFPDGMRDLLKSRAKENGRSLNAEIIARLMSTLEPPPHDPQTLAEFIDERLQATLNRALSEKGLTLDDVRNAVASKREAGDA